MKTFPLTIAQAVTQITAGAVASDLSSPTPCSQFDLKMLVNHLIGTTAALARVGRREPLDPADPYGAHHDATDGDWPALLSANIFELARDWAHPQVWQGTVDMGGQAMPAPMIGEMAVAEVALHGWDIAQSTGQRLVIEDDVAVELLRSIEETAELGRHLAAYGPEVAVDAQASPFARALAASGRRPH